MPRWPSTSRTLTPDDRDLIRKMYREYHNLRAEQLKIDRQLLELMQQRDDVLRKMDRVRPKELARKFEVSTSHVYLVVRPRSLDNV